MAIIVVMTIIIIMTLILFLRDINVIIMTLIFSGF